MTKLGRRLALVLVLAFAAPACGGDEDASAEESSTEKKKKKKKDESAAGGHGAKKGKGAESGPRTAVLAPRTFRDTDFVESEVNRDPFRSFVAPVGKGAPPPKTQRLVLMPNTPIQSVKLIAIVTGIAQPRAMMVDEKGVGYVASRGDFVGQAEVVQSGGSENLPVSLNWRVDRIRENEVILAREDPTGPNRPPLTRVIPLHEAEEDATAIRLPGQDS